MGANTAPRGKPARALRILHRSKLTDTLPAQDSQFVVDHSEWLTADTVLRPNVSLYSIEKGWATFVECSEGTTLLDLDKAHSFFYGAQFQLAKRIIRLPLPDFHALAAQINAPKPKQLIYLYSQGRCGSTLLSNVMGTMPNTVSLSEPDAYTSILTSKLSHTEKMQLLTSVCRYEGHVVSSGSIERIVIKLRSQCTPQAAQVAEVCPEASMFFLYRDAVAVAFSMVKTFGDLPVLRRVLQPASPMSPAWLNKFLLENVVSKLIVLDNSTFAPDINALGGYGKVRPVAFPAAAWVQQCECYTAIHQDKKLDIPALRYEDLVARPKDFFVALCKVLDVSPEKGMVEAVMSVMGKDSQAKSSISKGKKMVIQLGEEDKETVLAVLRQHHTFNYPGYVLEGTLLH